MNLAIEEVLKYLQSHTRYFESFSKEHLLMIPEYEISKEILDFITAKMEDKDFQNFQKDDIQTIVNIFNKIQQVEEHFNGSGWYDFSHFAVPNFIRFCGYNVEVFDDCQKMILVE